MEIQVGTVLELESNSYIILKNKSIPMEMILKKLSK